MHTTSKILNRDYITVNTVGEGEAEFYQNGVKTSGWWKNANNGLRFYSTKSTPTSEGVGAPTGTPTESVGEELEEIKFVPGKMWIEVITKS